MSAIDQICLAVRDGDMSQLKRVWDADVANSTHLPKIYHSKLYVFHLVVSWGRFDMLEYMLENGADPNLKTSIYGNTPLKFAFGWSAPNTHVIRLLMKHGANPYIKNADGNSGFAVFYEQHIRHYFESYLVVELVCGEADNLFLDVWRVVKTFLYK